jgi:hypothetical protein
VAFDGGGAASVGDDSIRDHQEDEGEMANPNLGSLSPRDAPERDGDKGGGCGGGMELDGRSWVCGPSCSDPSGDDHTVKALGHGTSSA